MLSNFVYVGTVPIVREHTKLVQYKQFEHTKLVQYKQSEHTKLVQYKQSEHTKLVQYKHGHPGQEILLY